MKSKARQKFLALEEPSREASPNAVARQQWLQSLVTGFVQPSDANKAYYKVIVEALWPVGHGIPGPHVTEEQIRDAINNFRLTNKFGQHYQKPYIDVFRRVRELQGEEGLTGVARQGKVFQLIDLTLGPKRVPRVKLSESEWENIKEKYHYCCASCGKQEPEVRFQQDHKIPRVRRYDDSLNNWQPLCDECNNFKSVACRGCLLDCDICCWAFPEKFRPIRFSSELLEKYYAYCTANAKNPEEFAAQLLLAALS